MSPREPSVSAGQKTGMLFCQEDRSATLRCSLQTESHCNKQLSQALDVGIQIEIQTPFLKKPHPFLESCTMCFLKPGLLLSAPLRVASLQQPTLCVQDTQF